ncbi:extended synaptotagmin-3 isoform X2 [Macrotis lagotis]|uniref:extended synaptotagmin-3 isoform X2 n=1 Tax=Macrotis lagotis TaxID=92651 RepID=UPI003D68BDBD
METQGDPAAPGVQAPGVKEPQLPKQLLPELYGFVARVLLYLAPVYLAGYLGLSLSWLILGAFLWMWWRKNRRWKHSRLAAAFEFLDNERKFIGQELREQQLPAWIHFPDVERVEWINKIISQTWPYLGMIMEKKIREKLEPKIREKSIHLKTFTFTKLCFGQKCPKVNGVKAHTSQCNRRRIMLDLQICYIGDCEIRVEIQKMPAGVNGIQLQGTLRVILEPLLFDKPFVGAVTIFFLQKPHLQINWTGLMNLLDAPGINDVSDSMFEDLIAAHLVLPNRVTIPVKKGMNITNLRFPLPCGVIRVHLLAAEKLERKDGFLGLKGKSDPYALVTIGLQSFRSKTVCRNLNPTWNEVFEFIVYEVPGQDLEVDLYDEDTDKDDFLGSLQINLGDVMKNSVVDEWFVLNNTTSGRLHLKLEWLSLTTYQEVMAEDPCGLSTAILAVFLEGACNLPRNPFEYKNGEYRAKKLPRCAKNRMDRDPSAYVKMCVGQTTQTSKFLHAEDREPGTPYTGPEVLKKGPVFIKRAESNQEPTAPSQEHDSILPFQSQNSETSDTKQANKNISVKLIPQMKDSEIKGKESDSGPQDQRGNKSTTTMFLTVPGSHSPGPIKSPRPMKCHASPFSWPHKKMSPSMSSLSSMASSCFDMTENSLATDTGGNCQPLGEIQLTVRYMFLRHSLVVLINGCRNLRPCCSSGADPYVRVYLLPERRWTSRKKTSVKRKTVNPQYDEKFEFCVPMEEVKKRTLDVAVKNYRPFGSHKRKELGKVLIDLSKEDLIKGFTQWYELTANGQTRS